MNPIHESFQKMLSGKHFLRISRAITLIKEWILSILELSLYFIIIYLCMKYESTTPMFSLDIARKPFFTEIKGHNSDNNEWILSIIELDLYCMIIYLCMKYESNTSMFSKDIARNHFLRRSMATTLIIMSWFYP